MYVGPVPHLYPLVRLEDEYPRYAAVMLEAHHARIYVFGLDTTPREAAIAGPAPRHRAVGGWSQARFHRHGENLHLERLDDVVESLDRIVTDEDLRRIVVTGHDAAVPRLREQLPRVCPRSSSTCIQLDRSAGEGRVLYATFEALRAQDSDTGSAAPRGCTTSRGPASRWVTGAATPRQAGCRQRAHEPPTCATSNRAATAGRAAHRHQQPRERDRGASRAAGPSADRSRSAAAPGRRRTRRRRRGGDFRRRPDVTQGREPRGRHRRKTKLATPTARCRRAARHPARSARNRRTEPPPLRRRSDGRFPILRNTGPIHGKTVA